MILIDGKEIASRIEIQVRTAIETIHGRKPGLAFLLIGDNPASKVYIKMKKKKCAEVGIVSYDRELPAETSQEDLIAEIERLNHNPEVDGILLQLPLPDHLLPGPILERISPDKDIDGFHPINMGKCLLGEAGGFLPCTPHGIHVLLQHMQIPLYGKHVVILGRSNIVGKPLAAILMQKAPFCNATVTVAHRCTEHLSEITKTADILIAAIGQPKFVTQEMIKPGAAIIDVGINKIFPSKNAPPKIVGDVDLESVAPLCSFITPVPGGVGPMTIAMLLANTLLSYQRNKNTQK